MYINMANVHDILQIVIVCYVSYVVSGAHTTHGEHTETDSMRFGYDPVLHHLVAITTGTCFIVPLTHDERDHIKSTSGLEEMEVKMMREWIGQLPEVRVYHDDTHLPADTKRWCATRDIFLLERDVKAMTSPKSPLVSVSP
ncbi:uncharacterized protein LOC123553827 [Mercenaria mercenaria]|uniref:uncharacterized protein LOC123553827 n=1 Tax=Mercenaria mercenaria TaxID=6596 RepID=UPI00234F4A1F|nr:uncharacterized protein LOC123553827 [Mercenaria mercenaria]